MEIDGRCFTGDPDTWVQVVPPGDGPPQHSHVRHDETFLAMKGTFLFKAAGETVEVSEGAWKSIPGGVVHAFYNPGPDTGELFIQTLPGGEVRGFFEEFNAIRAVQPLDQAAADRLNQRYEVVIAGPPLGAERA